MPFLRDVYASTRADELALTDWDDAQKAAFVAMQFEAQHRHYQQHYPGATFAVILYAGDPIGRLYLSRGAREIRIVDITILPAYRRQGIGTAILRAILAEGDRDQLRVSIHVEIHNPAQRLYRRLGFAPTAERGLYLLMERAPHVSI